MLRSGAGTHITRLGEGRTSGGSLIRRTTKFFSRRTTSITLGDHHPALGESGLGHTVQKVHLPNGATTPIPIATLNDHHTPTSPQHTLVPPSHEPHPPYPSPALMKRQIIRQTPHKQVQL